MSKHAELIARLEDAEAGNANLDMVFMSITQTADARFYQENKSKEPITVSSDAAIEYARIVLPGREITVMTNGPCHEDWFLVSIEVKSGAVGRFYCGSARTLALALCSAVLRALDAQEAV